CGSERADDPQDRGTDGEPRGRPGEQAESSTQKGAHGYNSTSCAPSVGATWEAQTDQVLSPLPGLDSRRQQTTSSVTTLQVCPSCSVRTPALSLLSQWLERPTRTSTCTAAKRS